MRVACKACGTVYAVADEKVRGRTFKSRCKKCGNWILVVGGAAGSEGSAISPPSAPTAARESTGSIQIETGDDESHAQSVEPPSRVRPVLPSQTQPVRPRDSRPRVSRPDAVSSGKFNPPPLPSPSSRPPQLADRSGSALGGEVQVQVRPTSPAKPISPSSRPLSPAPVVHRAPVALLVVRGIDQGRTFELDMDRELVIGASKNADISLGDTLASRKHASVRAMGTQLQLTDLGSTNGTFVNGARVDVAMLAPGDQVLVGLTVFQVVESTPNELPAYPASLPSLPIVRRFRLRVLNGPDDGIEYDIASEQPIILGSSKKADITITDDVMSRRHLQLKTTVDGLIVEDLGSTNGTFVNAERITDPVILRNDDRILVGKTILQVLED